ncbi:DUF2254 domain-containing protein [Marinimicrobium sp. C2-29]|uniref:DUF2254 domain-containing protein n=1 Tax=Marinimicrobium sp. C2-29 TaxID=3139825 RepID=UPI0031388168
MSHSSLLSMDRLRFLANRLKERLWVKPLALCLLSIGGAFIAKLADDSGLGEVLPQVSLDSVESLLSIMAASMLMIATFAVGSMVAAYASASAAATPRSIPLVIADDVTQNALSVFIGAFIFSLVSLIAVKNGFFGSAGLFAIFALTVFVFATVVITLMRWVDRIARLGRVVNTIERVEEATADALKRRRRAPTMSALAVSPSESTERGVELFSASVGYVQHIDMEKLQDCAEESGCHVTVLALPGTFVSAGRALFAIDGGHPLPVAALLSTVTIGRSRTFEDDPRFGLLALSEIADKALSTGVNDPGTAIDVIGAMVRLFTLWQVPLEENQKRDIVYDRISVPHLSVEDMFDDAFTAIARDGAGFVEVSVRLQRALFALSRSDDEGVSDAARKCSRMALGRSERVMEHEEDIDAVRQAATFSSAAIT